MHHRIIMLVASAAALGACASGTQVSSGGEVAAATPATRDYLPAGTSMTARLEQPLSTTSHEGDAFYATVTQAVYAQNGQIAVPAGAILRGHVTGIHTSNVPTDQNVIRLNFDALDMNGRSYPFSGSIADVSVQNSSTGGM